MVCYVNGSFHFARVSPSSCRTWFPGKTYLLQLRARSFDSSAGAVEIPTRCARHPGEEFAQQLGRSGFSVPLGPCWGTSTRELFSLRFWEVKLRRKQADFLTKRKRRAMSPSPFLVLLLARPTSCCRPSRNVCPWIHFPPPAKEL